MANTPMKHIERKKKDSSCTVEQGLVSCLWKIERIYNGAKRTKLNLGTVEQRFLIVCNKNLQLEKCALMFIISFFIFEKITM